MHEKNDPTAANMLDLIRDALKFDFAMTFTNAIGLVYSVMGDNLQNGSSVTAERKDEVLTVAGGSDVTAASFTLHGMPADLFCMYASWKTKDGRTWQMTVSAYSYDLPTVRFVVGRMLEDIVFGLPAA